MYHMTILFICNIAYIEHTHTIKMCLKLQLTKQISSFIIWAFSGQHLFNWWGLPSIVTSFPDTAPLFSLTREHQSSEIFCENGVLHGLLHSLLSKSVSPSSFISFLVSVSQVDTDFIVSP